MDSISYILHPESLIPMIGIMLRPGDWVRKTDFFANRATGRWEHPFMSGYRVGEESVILYVRLPRARPKHRPRRASAARARSKFF